MFGDRNCGYRPKFGFQISILRALLSLMPVLAACQTAGHTDTGSPESAIIDSQKAIARNALDTGKPEAALNSLRMLLQQHPDDASLHNLMGLTQLSLKNHPRAIKEFQAAFKRDNQVATGLNLSSALISAGEYQRAARLLTQLLSQAESTSYAYKERLYHNLGYTYAKERNSAKAELWLQRAVEENPTFFLSHLELARLYERSNRPEKAVASYRKAMDYCLVCFEPVQALSSLYIKTGRTGEARRVLMQFGKNEGVSADDLAKAKILFTQVTANDLPIKKVGG